VNHDPKHAVTEFPEVSDELNRGEMVMREPNAPS
jgi:hypothetical protein